jgi:succinate-semialdehyde dehydrogenase/glutarate-semialdehyde dehydrogenase
VLCEVADARPQDGVAALDAAVAAQADWAATAPRERGEILRSAFEAVIRRIDELALLMTLEMGKPLADSRAEITYGAEFLRWFSEESVRIGGDYRVAPDGRSRLVVMRQPVGPCVMVTPWNFPLAMATRKIGPAIASGCTMVVKPAAQTPLSMLALAAILHDAGLPPGVLNVVTTSDAGGVIEPLLADERLRKLSFTGSTPVGRRLLALAAPRVLRTSMELGGNAPFLVFADADLDAAAEGAVLAKMRNMGEACTASNRFYAEASVAGAFSEVLAARLGAMKIGRGTDPGVEVGPLIDARAQAKVSGLVDDAVAAGAAVLTGGAALSGRGHFFAPTVLSDVPPSARLLSEEIFGPVAPVVPFADEAEAIASANATDFGLVAYAYTRDLDRAVRVAERLEAGMVGINRGLVSNPAAPFGGVKQSGVGREGGFEGIEEYVEVKYVALAT